MRAAVDKCLSPCLRGQQTGKDNECFRPLIYGISLYLPVSLYITIGNLGTKASKKIVVMSVLICEKVDIYKGLHNSREFDSIKSNTIFYSFSATLYIEATIASASASKSPSCSSFTLDLNVTMFSRIFIFFIPSRISFICLPAFGPQEPF